MPSTPPLAALALCAGLAGGGAFPPIDTMTVNFIGTRYLTECMLPLMGPGGSIILTGSSAGTTGAPGGIAGSTACLPLAPAASADARGREFWI